MNRYPAWKYILILLIVAFGFLYAAPNLYAPDPAVQVSGASSALQIDERTLKSAEQALSDAGIEFKGGELGENSALIRLNDIEDQLPAKRAIQAAMRDDYVVALNLASTTPEWLSNLGAQRMTLGLDLAGGVHFLMEVDTADVVGKNLETLAADLRAKLRAGKARYRSVKVEDNAIVARFRTEELASTARSIIRKEYTELTIVEPAGGNQLEVRAQLLDQEVKRLEDYAINQNLTTLRNRVNELGVAEPIVLRQGRNRIVVELPGVQDTAAAKRVIGKTANLEFRLEAAQDALVSNKEYFEYRDEQQQQMMGGAWLEKKVIINGDRVSGARVGYDENGRPQINIDLDATGGNFMHRSTWKNVGRRMGVLFIESKTRTVETTNEQGETVLTPERYEEKKVISLATIQSALGRQFRITGVEAAEAQETALLLRAGALAAPMYFVEERVIGPSLGADNIKVGVDSVKIGLIAVLIFMLIFYKVFGIAANIALAVNLVLLVGVMSLFGATLTLPGIAGIVLTVGMAVDANVLIFSRIKEELRNGLPPQSAINSGFDRAFTTILDANITTLIVAVILFSIGSGPVKGFAVTLSIGILTSMFTAIMGTRAIVNMIYGGRHVKKLWI
ncbi:protein translocase subunit SecD [Biformimicrobium ophioploci]|uniref:Protein translocase subunit SecD n=1 Tax=Biformimicrobium ophioploci TaxID=3036711 RepID=A0ABQ6LXE4_9GAMM|nr:protein translocase subunit SecD [Microbulbifer sp. NKW57]GMG86778.1 protein translocase subunit SecD [Microbulbifer sp. NKW57]